MNSTAQMLFAIFLGIGVLYFALRTGGIGGAGAGATRDKNPILYWMGVSITGGVTAIAIIILIWTLLGLPPPLGE